jgi:general secretion pathway protein M
MKEYLANLSDSERRTAIIGAVVVALLLFYGVVWDPLAQGIKEQQKTVADQKALLGWMQAASAEAKVLRAAQAGGGSTRRTGQSLLAVVDQTAKRGKLGSALSRVEPKGADVVRVRLEEASFDDFIAWIVQLQNTYGITVESVSLDRQDAPGRVDVSLTLEGAAS